MVSNVSHCFSKFLKGDLEVKCFRAVFDNSNNFFSCMTTCIIVIAVVGCFLLTPGIKTRTSAFLHKWLNSKSLFCGMLWKYNNTTLISNTFAYLGNWKRQLKDSLTYLEVKGYLYLEAFISWYYYTWKSTPQAAQILLYEQPSIYIVFNNNGTDFTSVIKELSYRTARWYLYILRIFSYLDFLGITNNFSNFLRKLICSNSFPDNRIASIWIFGKSRWTLYFSVGRTDFLWCWYFYWRVDEGLHDELMHISCWPPLENENYICWIPDHFGNPPAYHTESYKGVEPQMFPGFIKGINYLWVKV